jgi:hypothetical protein
MMVLYLMERLAKYSVNLSEVKYAPLTRNRIRKDNHPVAPDLERVYEKYNKLSGRLGGVSVFLDRLEREKKSYIEEKDRLLHRIKQLELDLRTQQEVSSDLSALNNEYCTRTSRRPENDHV